MRPTEEGIRFNKALEDELDRMSPADILDMVPWSFIRSTAKGFLAGMRGPKQYKKNNWMELDLDPVKHILPSWERHIDHYKFGRADPDTGIPDNLCFSHARGAMTTEFVTRLHRLNRYGCTYEELREIEKSYKTQALGELNDK